MARGSRLRLIGGPNGSGKSTLLRWLLERAGEDRFPLGFVQNPDSLQREIETSASLYLGSWGVQAAQTELLSFVRSHPLFRLVKTPLPKIVDDVLVFKTTKNLGYLIPVLCDFFRVRWIARGESFTFETVMSGPDKLEILEHARNDGYRTYLYFVCTDDVRINEARIENRVKSGGHSVPSEKITKRYEGSLAHLRQAIELADRAFIFDNSRKEPQLLATFEKGKATWLSGEELPGWFLKHALRAKRVGPIIKHNVHVTRTGVGQWRVSQGGRTVSVHRTQASAVNAGGRVAKHDGVGLVTHGRDGRIRSKDSYGNDPLPPRDRQH